MKKKYVLNETWLINKIIQKGFLIKRPFWVIRFNESKSPYPRFCIIISSKMSKLAVKRNKLRRRIRESIRHNIYLLKKPVNFVLLCKANAIDQSFKNIEKEILDFFKNIRS